MVDPNGKIMTLKTINLTFCRHISVDEMLYYTPHPTEPSKTLLKQEATVSVHGVPLSHYMEDLLTNRISSNAGNGRQGLEWVISKINTEVYNVFFIITSNSFGKCLFLFIKKKKNALCIGIGSVH